MNNTKANERKFSNSFLLLAMQKGRDEEPNWSGLNGRELPKRQTPLFVVRFSRGMLQNARRGGRKDDNEEANEHTREHKIITLFTLRMPSVIVAANRPFLIDKLSGKLRNNRLANDLTMRVVAWHED